MNLVEAIQIAEKRSDCSRECLDALVALVQRVEKVRGAIVECGCYKGGSLLVLAAAAPERQVYGFDLFGGLPYGKGKGFEYLADADFAEVTHAVEPFPNICLVKGMHEETVPSFPPRPLALLHMDSDHYASHKVCLEHFWPMLEPGGIAAFHDWTFLDVQNAVQQTVPEAEIAETGLYVGRVGFLVKR